MYEVPTRFYQRLHHPRPRFKSNIENVLGYMAFSIAELDGQDESTFKDKILCALSDKQYSLFELYSYAKGPLSVINSTLLCHSIKDKLSTCLCIKVSDVQFNTKELKFSLSKVRATK